MRNLELQVINSALLDRDHAFKLLQYDADIIQSGDLQSIRAAIADLFATESAVDLPSVYAKAKNDYRNINIDRIAAELSALGKCMNIDYVLKQLDERRKRVKIHAGAVDLINALKRGELNYDEIIDSLISEYQGERVSDFTDLMEYINNNDLDDIFKSLNYLRTNIEPLDDKLFGFYGGQLVLIAARPAVGKSSLAIEIAESVNEPVLFFSLEMNKQEIYAKILSKRCGIESWKILFNKLEPQERVRLMEMHNHLKTQFKITLFDGEMDLQRLIYYINHFVQYKQPRLIIIDYIQLLHGAKGENQNVRTGTISRTLKLLAMKHRIPIIALSQLSRSNEKEKRKPQLSDLRDSGSLEQDANTVIFLYENDQNETVIGVAKNRMGRTGTIHGLQFEKEYSRFINTGV